ncbi:MAG: glycerophosphodiester phosphodiesterase [Desulforhopalus sp.]
MIINKIIFIAIAFLMLPISLSHGAPRIIIAENGGGNDLLEHTLPAVTLAAVQGADYLGISVVATADSELVVFNDLTLNRLTDVASVFFERSREDGNYYVIDFTLNELRQLRLMNVFDTGPVSLSLSLPTLKEELSLIRRLETLLNRKIGIALEIEKPWFHSDEGQDISGLVLDALQLFNYNSDKDKIYLQCFDPEELQRIHNKLLPEKEMNLQLIQLIGKNDGLETRQRRAGSWEPYNYDWLYTNIGMRMIASYGAAIGLPGDVVADKQGTLLLGDYIESVQKHGLKVLVYSVDSKKTLEAHGMDLPALLELYTKAGIDGFYTNSFYEVKQTIEAEAKKKERHSDLPEFFSDLELSRPSAGNQTPDAGIH